MPLISAALLLIMFGCAETRYTEKVLGGIDQLAFCHMFAT